MVLKIPGGLFKQSDVRETPAGSSSSSSTIEASTVILGNSGLQGDSIGDGTTRYLNLSGTSSGGHTFAATEAYHVMPRAGTLKNLYIYITTNGINGNVDF